MCYANGNVRVCVCEVKKQSTEFIHLQIYHALVRISEMLSQEKDEKARKMVLAISWNFRYTIFVVYCQLHAMGSVNSFYLLQIGLHPFAFASRSSTVQEIPKKTRHGVTSTLPSVMVYIVSRYNVPEFANQQILYSVNHNEINSLIKFML